MNAQTGRYAARTEVSVEKSRAEIEATVRRYRADAFVSGWEGPRAFVRFRIAQRFVRMTLTLPDRDDPAFTDYHLGKVLYSRKPEEAQKRWDQACRQKWRQLALVIKAKLEAVDAGIVTFEEEFFAHVVMPDGRSLYQHVKEPIAIAYEKGASLPLLPGAQP